MSKTKMFVLTELITNIRSKKDLDVRWCYRELSGRKCVQSQGRAQLSEGLKESWVQLSSRVPTWLENAKS